MDAVNVIRRDYSPAEHDSGPRKLTEVHFVVLHDMEDADKLTAAEDTGRWFQNLASKGSAHYGCDNDSTQQYLGLGTIAWGAPPLNDDGVHIEMAGRAAFARGTWMNDYRKMLHRTAWLISYMNLRLGIPIKHVSRAQLAALGADPTNDVGVVLHSDITYVFHESTHTDPGVNFPIDFVIEMAKCYATPRNASFV